MKDKNENKVIKSNTFIALLAIAILTMALTKTAMAKSLYIISDIWFSEDRKQPVQAYDIGVDGTLTFQAQYDIPHRMLGAVGMAIDSDYGYIFITYEASGEIQLIDATRMTDAGVTVAPDAQNLAGIVYDHEKSLLYCVDRQSKFLYVYNWYPESATLTHVPGSPFELKDAHAYGIALNEIDDLLYVANASNVVTVYRTSDWELVDTITLSRIAISIALDVRNGYVYTGGGYAGNMFLTQYHLATGTEKEVQVEPDAGVMGLAVDPDTGLVYLDTGSDNAAGGDNLMVYDKALNQVQFIAAIGNPTGLAIPGRNIGYNPLNLSKQVIRGATAGIGDNEIKTVAPGDTYTYGIYFDNTNNYKVTDVSIVDMLPREVTFVTADDDGVNGFFNYDEQTDTQTYTWLYSELPPGTSTLLEITVKVKPNVDTGRVITNSVTINTNETPPTTTAVDVLTTSNALNLKKGIVGVEDGRIAKVNTGDIITYYIEFDNKDNDFAVTGVSVVDELPKDVTFISADNAKGSGKYDSKERTYTWTFDSLGPGEVVHLELVVSVNQGLPIGTTITNIVTIDSNETPESSTSVDAVTYYKPLSITKKTLDSSGGSEITSINPGEKFIYQICFDNINDAGLTEVLLEDKLPSEVTFVSAQADNKNFVGHYDSKEHTYTGTLVSLGMEEVCVDLLVQVNENTPIGTVIANSVTVKSNETEPNQADVDLHVGEIQFELDNVCITPSELRRNGTSPLIKAVLQLPEGFKQSDIDPSDQPVLYYLDRNTGKPIRIGSSVGGSYLTGTYDMPTITVYFSRPELMNAVPYYGGVCLRIEGKLKEQTYYGSAVIHITIFAGD
jgi:uncharacterized repeat protein (TIGR01451 family)/fimbrial isopeptide formation D2 family protein